jgi:hypothetical protein
MADHTAPQRWWDESIGEVKDEQPVTEELILPDLLVPATGSARVYTNDDDLLSVSIIGSNIITYHQI